MSLHLFILHKKINALEQIPTRIGFVPTTHLRHNWVSQMRGVLKKKVQDVCRLIL